MIGKTLGPYEVVAKLGEGGMGQVFRGRDTKLGRDVAIKVLPDAFTADAERLARFEREARTLAALNHPNIAQIYGMEHGALVMELCPGEDLADMMRRGPIPLHEALPIARQIAAALAVAHEAGIIHRDLKPANIKVAPDGAVKVLDFGLAKALDPGASGASANGLANSPTITSSATQFGVILGTAAYMSPEQARGKPVDRRADVWAFGVVLYEMLTGRRAFQGSEVSDVLASVLKDTIDLDTLPAGTPNALRRLLRRCLEKDRSLRLDSMTAARLEIEDAIVQPVDGAFGAVTPANRPLRSTMWWVTRAAIVITTLALAVLAGYLVNGGLRVPPSPRAIAFTLPMPSTRVTGVAITRLDAVVYVADRLYVKTIGDPDARALAGTEGADNVFVSTDGQWAGFYAGGKIKKVSLAGSDPLDVTSAATDSPGASWGPGNTVVFSSGWNAPLSSVSADGGGVVTAISRVDTAAGELGHWWPRLLPDGKSLLFTVWMSASGINDSKIAVLDLATGTHRVVMSGADAQYLSTGHIVYFSAGGYTIVPFDLATLRPTGEPRAILPDARPLSPTGGSSKTVAVSDNGTVAYLAGKLVPLMEFAWVGRTGTVEAIDMPKQSYGRTSMSPDGRRAVSVVVESGRYTLHLLDLIRKTDERLDLPGTSLVPLWSPTGDFIAHTSMVAGHFDAYAYNVKEGRSVPVMVEPYDQMPIAVSPDGKRLMLVDYLSDGSSGLAVAEIDRPKERRKRTVSVGETNLAMVSPDGRWVAVETTASGRSEIVVQPFPHDGRTVTASSRGGTAPIWSRTGSTLYYQRDDELVAATWSSDGGRFDVTTETVLWRLASFGLVGQAADGRFLVTRQRAGGADKLRVVTNWLGDVVK